MKKIIIYIFILTGFICIPRSYSQKMDKTNPTYFTSDHRNIYNLVQWNTEPFEQISFCRDSSIRSEGNKMNFKKSDYPQLKSYIDSPFILDTTVFNESGYCYYYPNTSWFQQLHRINLTKKTAPTVFGILESEISFTKIQIKDLFKMLIQFGVVDTYFHLYAELIITKEKEDTEKVEINYHCRYHFCTSDCFDPEYDFSLTYIKKTGELVAQTK